MNITKKLLLTVLICSIMSAPSYAKEKMHGTSKHIEKGERQIFKGLNLTEDQKKQLQANKQKQKQQMKSDFEKIKAQKQAFHEELMKPEIDMNKINAIHKQLKVLKDQAADNRLNSILEVRKILTPEQFGKFLGAMKERRYHWKEGQSTGPMKDEKIK